MQDNWSRLLGTRNLSELDREVNRLQAEFESGRVSEAELLKAIEPLAQEAETDTEYGQILANWAQQNSNSYAARLVYGVCLAADGFRMRGMKLANDIGDVQRRNMVANFNAARRELLESIPLTGKPIISFITLMRIEMISGGEEGETLIAEYYRRALEAHPASMAARKQRLATLRAEWGGETLEAMQRFLDEPHHAILSAEQRRELLALRFHYEGHWFENFADNLQQALQAFSRAVDTFPDGAHYLRRSAVLSQMGKLKEAEDDMAKGLDLARDEELAEKSTQIARLRLACALYDKSRWNPKVKTLIQEIRSADRQGDITRIVEEHTSGGVFLWLLAKVVRPFVRNS